ncbi:hypothetical protein Gpo141_00009001 [Globisporangium polare]
MPTTLRLNSLEVVGMSATLHLTQRNGAWLSAEDEIVELLRRDTGITGDIQQTMLQDTQPNATCTVED